MKTLTRKMKRNLCEPSVQETSDENPEKENEAKSVSEPVEHDEKPVSEPAVQETSDENPEKENEEKSVSEPVEHDEKSVSKPAE